MVSRVGPFGPVQLHFRYWSTEVRVPPFEGKREQAQDETKQAILKQENAGLHRSGTPVASRRSPSTSASSRPATVEAAALS